MIYRKVPGERFGAGLIDFIITAILSITPVVIFVISIDNLEAYAESLLTQFESGDLTFMNEYLFYLVAIEAVIHFVYFVVIPTVWNGQTLGKKLFKIKAVDVRGNNLSLWKHFLRNIQGWGVYVSFSLFLVLGFVNFDAYSSVNGILSNLISLALFASLIMLFATSDGRGLHDMVADSYVISVGAQVVEQKNYNSGFERNTLEDSNNSSNNNWDF